jgi:hypothetical protein
MNVSPAYEKEYREWIQRGQLERVYPFGAQMLQRELLKESPFPYPAGGALGSIATCYYRRGAVALLDQNAAGWQDIQCGYWATVYSLRFLYKAATLPAFGDRRPFGEDRKTATVMTLGLARLFGQDGDAAALEAILGPEFNIQEALGDEIDDGRMMLEAILHPTKSFSYDELLSDRNQCCKKREAWIKRPTEIDPFGVIDIEAMLRFPEQASFRYPRDSGFNPTEDELLIKVVTAYHCNYGD